MPYIGNTIRAADDYRLIDDISSGFNGNDTTFALQVAGSAPVPFPKSPQQVLISVNGVIQEPDPTGASGFNLVGTNIVFSSAPTNGHAFFGIIYATADYLNAGGNFPAGSLGAPSITFIGDENTGLFRKGSGSVGFVSDATEIANFDSNGITISSGNLIIPDSIIHNGDSDTKIRFSAANTVSVETAGTQRLEVASDGKVNFGSVARVEADGVFKAAHGDASTPAYNFLNDNDNGMFRATTNTIGFSTGGSERVRIDSSGDVGIGITNPTSTLHLDASGGAVIQLQRTSSNASNRLLISHDGTDATLESSNALLFRNNGAERARITSTGRLGIGNTNPQMTLDVTGDFAISNSASSYWNFDRDNSSGDLLIDDTGTEIMRIAVSGTKPVLIGTTTVTSDKFAVLDEGNAFMSIRSNAASDNVIQTLDFAIGEAERTSANMTGAITAIVHSQSGGTLKSDLQFRTNSGNNINQKMVIKDTGNVGIGTDSPQRSIHQHISSSAANYHLFTNSTTGSGAGDGGIVGIDASENLILWNQEATNTRFATNNSERMRIDGNGNVGIGTTSPSALLNVNTPESGTTDAIIISRTTSGTVGKLTNTTGALQITSNKQLLLGSDPDQGFTAAGSNIQFSVDGNERMRLDAAGNLGIGLTSPTHSIHCVNSTDVAKFDHTGTGDTVGIVMRHGRGGLSGFNGKMISFVGNGNAEKGSINIHTNSVAYNTSSDYRLKENEVAISDGITRLKQLKPYIFNFKKDPNVKVDGFFAHEVSSVVPEAITGTKDEVDSNGDPIYQGIDQSKLVPLLVAALQEAVTKIETLETKVAALEAA